MRLTRQYAEEIEAGKEYPAVVRLYVDGDMRVFFYAGQRGRRKVT